MARTAVITGAARGIGRETALRLARDGWQIAACAAARSDLLETLRQEISAMGVPCFVMTGDVGTEDFVRDFFAGIRKVLGVPDVLINNAGISYIGLLQDMTLEEWDRMLRTDLTSVFLCCREVIPEMVRRQEGRILNVSSMWGTAGASCEAAYSAAKGGVNTLTKALAKELAPSHIAVNAMAFGVVDTDMNRCFTEEERAELAGEIPAGRFAGPDEAADAIAKVLALPEYVTGQVIGMDGGFL